MAAQVMGDCSDDVEYGDFEASRDHLGKRFTVQGEVVVAHAGLRASLEPARPGINPDDLRLILAFQPDFEAPSEKHPEYAEEWEGVDPPTYSRPSFTVESTSGEIEPPPQITKLDDVY